MRPHTRLTQHYAARAIRERVPRIATAWLLKRFLDRLGMTGALTVTAEELEIAMQDILEEVYPKR